MTPQQIEAMKLALEALELCNGAETVDGVVIYTDKEITAIKEVLAEHAMQEVQRLGQEIEQEPVAWIEKYMQCDDFDPDSVTCEKPTIVADGWEWVPLYTSPPQRKPLTHEQRLDLLYKFEAHKHEWHAHSILIDMVEAAHGIKGDA